MRYLFQILFVIALTSPIVAQTATGKNVEWQSVNGEKGEFAVGFPANYQTAARDSYYRGGPGSSPFLVEKELKVFRDINGVILMLEYYKGGAKRIQEDIEKAGKSTRANEQRIGDFVIKSFSNFEKGETFVNVQHFLIKDRLYILKSSKKLDESPIAKGFFDSVRLQIKGKVAAPNVPSGENSTTLPTLVEVEPIRIEDSAAVDPINADRKPVVVYSPNPSLKSLSAGDLKVGRLRLKVLYSSSGKVASVEILETPSKGLAKATAEAIKQTIFIPAQKDGKFVSVYVVEDRSLTSTAFTMRIN